MKSSMAKSYLGIWRNFNRFLLKLDEKPENWEERISLYLAFIVENGAQSSTVKSYYSAIKKTFGSYYYSLDESQIFLNTLTSACRLLNDQAQTRLPIHIGLLEILVFELERMFPDQFYLRTLYQTMMLLGYYGLLRIGEMTASSHVIKAKNVHISVNKNKLLLVLYSSKTHGKADRPQKIKIEANESCYQECSKKSVSFAHSRCPSFFETARWLHR